MSQAGYVYRLETDSLDFMFIHINEMYSRFKDKLSSHSIYVGPHEYTVIYELN